MADLSLVNKVGTMYQNAFKPIRNNYDVVVVNEFLPKLNEFM